MEEKKNKTVLTIIAVITLITLIATATYAYFSVGTTNNFGTKIITASTDEIGAVTLNGSEAALSMNLTAVDMMKNCYIDGIEHSTGPVNGASADNNTKYNVSTLEKNTGKIELKNVAQICNDVTYYASTEGKTTTPTEEVLGTASVSPNTDTNYYHCTYTLNLTQTNTGTKNMYNIFKGITSVNGSTYTSSANELILTVNGEDYDLHSDTLPKEIPGEFYIKGAQTVDITAGLRLINKGDKDQTLLAGSDMQISINVVNDSFKCTAEEEPDEVVAYYTYEGEQVTTANAHKVSDYRNLNVFQRTYSYQIYSYADQSSCESSIQGSETCSEVTQPYFIKETAREVTSTQDMYEVLLSQDSGTTYNTYGTYTADELSTIEANELGGTTLTCDGETETALFGSMKLMCETHAAGYTFSKLENEVCADINGTVICIESDDWENSDDYKSRFENAGWICSYASEGKVTTWGDTKPENGYLKCAPTDPSNGLTNGVLNCHIHDNGYASCLVNNGGYCGVETNVVGCDKN